jgi:integrase/recombinase XerD
MARAPSHLAQKVGGRLNPKSGRHIISRAAAKPSINPAISPHWLRHAHASHGLERAAIFSRAAENVGPQERVAQSGA